MLAEKLEDLINQPLEGWRLERWYAVSKPRRDSYPTTNRVLVGYCRHAGAVTFLAKHLNNPQTSGRQLVLASKPLLVLTNGQTTINLKTGKRIQQTAECIRADGQAQASEQTRATALAKLSAAEKKALGLV